MHQKSVYYCIVTYIYSRMHRPCMTKRQFMCSRLQPVVLRASSLHSCGSEGLTFPAVRPAPVRRVLASDPVTNMLLGLALWPLVQSWLCCTDVLAPAPLWVLCPGEEPGHPEKPRSNPHLQSTLPGCKIRTPTAASLYHPYPQQTLNSLLWHSPGIQHVTCPTLRLLFGNGQTAFHIP